MLPFLKFWLFSILFLVPFPGVRGTYIWPNRLVEELEHLLVDTSGYNDGGFAIGVTPCSFYFQGPQTTGRDTAGQWMRVGFHDFATADVAKGTGGMDASIGWETTRPENSGTAMNDSLSFFNPFVNKYASMADMIALGTVMAAASCNGPIIPFKSGRIDAAGPGEFGVPEPDTDIKTTLDQFTHAGFSQIEAIQLTACGHTVGRVHHAGFPTVVGPEAVTPNNTQGGVDFDSTEDVYDNKVVSGYLDGTTTNALVTSFNVSSRSDLRIFSSDQNTTMKDLAAYNAHFLEVCKTVVAKQLNTVPKTVVLQDVAPIPLKPTNVQVTVDISGSVVLTGDVRLLASHFPPNPTRSVVINHFKRDGSFGGSVTAQPVTMNTTGSSVYADTQTFFHAFSLNVPSSIGLSAFTVTVKEKPDAVGTTYDNAGNKYRVQDTVVWIPALTNISVNGDIAFVNVVAAVHRAFSPTAVNAVFSVPFPQLGTLNPKITSATIILTSMSFSPSASYVSYSGTIQIPSLNNTVQRTTFDIVALNGGHSGSDDFRKLSTLVWPS